MQRKTTQGRPDFKQRLEREAGILHHSHDDGGVYWVDNAYYQFAQSEVRVLEEVTETLMDMCIRAVEHVIEHKLYAKLGIAPELIPLIEWSWENEPPSVYKRFDLAYDGVNPPKMLELNGTTPTSLLEAAVGQWQWKEQLFPNADQFNWIWEALVEKWTLLRKEGSLKGDIVYGTSAGTAEDAQTVRCMLDAAIQAGFTAKYINLDDIDFGEKSREFFDMTGPKGLMGREPSIYNLFAIVPIEWLVGTKFFPYLMETREKMVWMEPWWNLVYANKGILAILWELFPNHPNLVPAYLDGPHDMQSYVVKPCQSREGANVTIVQNGEVTEETGGERENDGPMVYQQYVELPVFDGNHTVVGSWYVPDVGPCGIGMREADSLITGTNGRFVPHIVL